jgi:Leucine-rich repeat (LRR) protein
MVLHLWQLTTVEEAKQASANLTTFFMSNNQIKSFSDLDALATLDNLKCVLFIGNPMYDKAANKDEARLRVLARLP